MPPSHLPVSRPWTFWRPRRYGQFSEAQSGKMGPAPGRFKLSRGILKWKQVRPSIRIFANRDYENWPVGVGPRAFSRPRRRGPRGREAGTPVWNRATANLRKILEFGGSDSSRILILRGGNSQAHRGFPGMFESGNLSRDNLSREIGRSLIWPEALSGACTRTPNIYIYIYIYI